MGDDSQAITQQVRHLFGKASLRYNRNYPDFY